MEHSFCCCCCVSIIVCYELVCRMLHFTIITLKLFMVLCFIIIYRIYYKYYTGFVSVLFVCVCDIE